MTIVLLVKQKISKMEFRGNSELHCVLEHVFCFLRGAIEARGNSCTLLFEFDKTLQELRMVSRSLSDCKSYSSMS